MPFARCVGKLYGKKVFSFPCRVTFGEIAVITQECIYPKTIFRVISHTASDAADWITDILGHIPCVEVEVYGPRGGIATHRYWGYDRAIFYGMMKNRKDNNQLDLL